MQMSLWFLIVLVVAAGSSAWAVRITGIDEGTAILLSLKDTQNTIPKGVNCTERVVCNNETHCSIVCAHGTVQIPRWLDHAMRAQHRMAYKQPFCKAVVPGTHNSAITLADGYGNEDYVYEQIGQILDPKWFVRTNNQYFSLTDQLRLGMRFLELDTHWVLGELRLAHCGPHFKELDDFVNTIDKIIKDFHLNITIHWDSETLGCDPSLSSIPAGQQRSLASGFEEIANFLAAPENAQDFLMIFHDCQDDLLTWGKLPLLFALYDKYFGSMIYTPADFVADGNQFPTMAQMVARGKRILFMSGADYRSDPVAKLRLFYKYGTELCKWDEPDIQLFDTTFPICTYQGHPTDNGQILRPETAQLIYGIDRLNMTRTLTETTIPPLNRCNVNILCPDLMSPERASAYIWSYAENEPSQSDNCVTQSVTDGRWYSKPCSLLYPAACRTGDNSWSISARGVTYADAVAACDNFSSPVSGFDNGMLRLSLAATSFSYVWINV